MRRCRDIALDKAASRSNWRTQSRIPRLVHCFQKKAVIASICIEFVARRMAVP